MIDSLVEERDEDRQMIDSLAERMFAAATSIVALIMLGSRPFTQILCWLTKSLPNPDQK